MIDFVLENAILDCIKNIRTPRYYEYWWIWQIFRRANFHLIRSKKSEMLNWRLNFLFRIEELYDILDCIKD